MRKSRSKRAYVVLVCGLSAMLTYTGHNRVSANVSHQEAEALVIGLFDEIRDFFQNLPPADELADELTSLLDGHFDVPQMVMSIAVRHWDNATPAQRGALVSLPYQVIAAIPVPPSYPPSEQLALEIPQVEVRSSRRLREGGLAVSVPFMIDMGPFSEIELEFDVYHNLDGAPRITNVSVSTLAGINLISFARYVFDRCLQAEGGDIDRFVEIIQSAVATIDRPTPGGSSLACLSSLPIFPPF